MMRDPSNKLTNPPASRVRPAQLLGAVVGCLLLAGTLAFTFGPPRKIEWLMLTLLVGSFAGGSVAAAVQLRREGRSAKAGSFLGQQAMGQLLVLPIFVAATVGQRLYGDPGWWIGLPGSSALLFVGAVLFRRRSGNADPGDARERCYPHSLK